MHFLVPVSCFGLVTREHRARPMERHQWADVLQGFWQRAAHVEAKRKPPPFDWPSGSFVDLSDRNGTVRMICLEGSRLV